MEIQALKTQLDIYQVADRLGIQVNKYHKALCPFHDDKRPSLQFSKEKQIATCFSGNCDAGTMDVINLVEKKLNVSTHEAIKWLQSKFNIQGQTAAPQPKSTPTNYPKLFRVFEGNLKKSSKAKSYLEERGLNENLEIGYNGTAWEKMKHCVIFPLKDRSGQILSFYGRSTVASNHFYNSNRKGLYPGYPKAETETLILTESIIDNATLQQFTDYKTLALYGTNGLTTEHQQAIKELHQLKEIILFLDGDEAGKEAIRRNGEILNKLKPEIKLTYIETPEGEDINSLAQSHEPTIFKHLIDQRKPLSFSPDLSDSLAETPQSEPAKPTQSRLITTNPELLFYQNCVLNFTVLGGIKITGLDRLRVTLKIEHKDKNHLLPIRHNLDLYNNGQVEQLGQKVAEQMELTTQEAITAVAQLTNELEIYRERRLEALKPKKEFNENQLSTMIKQQCMAFGKAPKLMKRISQMVGQSGIIGEEKNRLALCVIASGHKNKATMHALIQGSSGSGKSHLMGAILDLMPKESVLCFTRVTESSLYNYGSHELKGKILGFEDWDGLEEKAEYAVRELISKEALVSSTSVKNEETGKISGAHHTVYGPVTTFACTTNGTIYEDNMNRVFVIAVDESREQTLRVIQYQNDKEAGLIDEQKEKEAREFLRNFMRTLEPCQVVNPYANKINLPPESDNLRRLNKLFKAFVRQITILHQFQRKRVEQSDIPTYGVGNVGRLITEKEDIRQAIEIMFDSLVLKVDELDGSLRDFYERLKSYVNQKAEKGQSGQSTEFTQREVRQAFRLSQSQVQRQMERLQQLEYISKSTVGIRNTHHYKISYWDSLEALRERIRKHLQDQLQEIN